MGQVDMLSRHLVVDLGTARANRKFALVDGKMMCKSPNIDAMHARQVGHPATVRRKPFHKRRPVCFVPQRVGYPTNACGVDSTDGEPALADSTPHHQFEVVRRKLEVC
jgi:hypothetical protein